MPGARPRRVVLLGPQALEITLGRVREELEREGVLPERAPVATITAGWQEREAEGDVLDRELGGRGVGLALYARSERVAEEDPEFARAHRETQDRLKVLRRAYDIRLGHLIRAHHELLGVAGNGDDPVLARERDAALDAIRALDARHLERVREIRADLERVFDPAGREAIARQRREVAEILRDVPAVAIAGGHVAALLNRLRLFDIGEALEGKVVIAWSAGAMALGGRVVLFHDHPPWGPGYTEAFDAGLSAYPDLIALPYATQRLALDDRERTARMARRFAPAQCALLDAGTRVEWSEDGWRAVANARMLDPAGGTSPLERRRPPQGERGAAPEAKRARRRRGHGRGEGSA